MRARGSEYRFPTLMGGSRRPRSTLAKFSVNDEQASFVFPGPVVLNSLTRSVGRPSFDGTGRRAGPAQLYSLRKDSMVSMDLLRSKDDLNWQLHHTLLRNTRLSANRIPNIVQNEASKDHNRWTK